MKHKQPFFFLSLLTILVMVLSACVPTATPPPAETAAPPVETSAPAVQTEAPAVAPALPAPPAFDSAGTPDDEGTVKPVDQKPAKPMKIAVLGLENNPFWIPVKEGTTESSRRAEALWCDGGLDRPRRPAYGGSVRLGDRSSHRPGIRCHRDHRRRLRRCTVHR